MAKPTPDPIPPKKVQPQPYNPDEVLRQAQTMMQPRDKSAAQPARRLKAPTWSPYNRPPTQGPGWNNPTAQPYWANPQRIARAHLILNAMPNGYEMPEWMQPDVIEPAYQYLQAINPDKPWYEWDDNLPDTDPLYSVVAGMPAPVEAQRGIVPSANQILSEFGLTREDQLREGITDEDLFEAYRVGVMGMGATGTQGAAETGIPDLTTEEIDAQYAALKAANPGSGLWIDWAKTNGLDPREVEKMIANGTLWWQAPAAAVFRTAGGNMAQQAVNFGLMGAGIGGVPGAVVGGTAGAALGLAGWNEQDRMAEMGENYTPSTIMKIMQWLNVPWETLQRILGIGVQVQSGWQTRRAVAGEKSMGILPDQYFIDALRDVITNWDAAWYAGSLLYTSAPASILYDINLLRGEGMAQTQNTWQIGIGDPTSYDVNMLPMWAASQDIRGLIESGMAPLEAVETVRQRYGFVGELSDLVAGYLLDPLDSIGPFTNLAGGKIADLKGNRVLKLAFDMSEGPVEAMRNYGILLRTGSLGTTRAELGAMDGFTRWIAQVGRDGNDLPVRAFKLSDPRSWFSVKPQSRANEVLANNITNLSYILQQSADPMQMGRDIRGLAGISVEDGARMSQAMPWLQSTEGGALPAALRDFGQKLDTLETAWTANEPNRRIVLQMAQDLGLAPGEMLRQFKVNGEALFNKWQSQIAARAGGGTAQAMAQSLRDGTLTYASVKKLVDGFLGDVPLTPENYRGILQAALTEHMAGWAVKFFGVKPDPKWERLSQAVKASQSFLLLGLNPMYLVNNLLNNQITMMWGQVFGLHGKRQIEQFWQRFGMMPARLRAGIGGAAGIDDLNVTGAVREAIGRQAAEDARAAGTKVERGGLLEAYANLFRENGPLGKIQLVTRLSQGEERAASAQAYTVGTQRAWRRLWQRGQGFSRMDRGLEQALAAINPQLPGMIYAAAEGSMNWDELQARLWQGVEVMSVDAAIPDVVERLRRGGMDIDAAGVHEALEHMGIKSFLMERLHGAKNQADVRRAVAEARTMMRERLDNLARQNRETVAQRATERAVAEGVAGVLDVYDQMYYDLGDFWARHTQDNEAVFAAAEKLDAENRGKLHRQQDMAASAEWRRMMDYSDDTLRGVIRGLGADDGDLREVTANLATVRDLWGTFFADRRRMLDEFFNTTFESKQERSMAWTVLQDKLDQMYAERLAAEDGVQAEIDVTFARLIERQTGQSSVGALAWRKGVRDARIQMGEAMRAHRKKMLDVDPKERRERWQLFMARDYRPMIAQLRNANLEQARAMYGVATGADAGRVGQQLVRRTIADMWSDLLAPYGILNDGQWVSMYRDLNRFIETGERPFTDMDCYISPTAERWAQLERALARWSGEEGQAGGEPPVPPSPAPADMAPVITPEMVQAAEAAAAEVEMEVRRVANEFGLASAKADGSPNTGFERHLVAIVQKYGGAAGREVKNIRQITPELARQALTARSRFKRAEGNLDEMPKPVQNAVWAERQKQAVSRVWRAKRAEWHNAPDAATIRAFFTDDLYKAFGEGREFSQARQEIDAAVSLIEAHAAVWAEQHGKTVDDWWISHVAGVAGRVDALELLGEMSPHYRKAAADGGAAAVTMFMDDGRAIIGALTAPDASTLPHELGHVFLRDVPAADRAAVLEWIFDAYGIDAQDVDGQFVGDGTVRALAGGGEVSVATFIDEAFAMGFEKYLAEGRAPTMRLEDVFKRFKAWLKSIYTSLTKGYLGQVKLSDTMRGVYDRLLRTESYQRAVEAAEAARWEHRTEEIWGTEYEVWNPSEISGLRDFEHLPGRVRDAIVSGAHSLYGAIGDFQRRYQAADGTWNAGHGRGGWYSDLFAANPGMKMETVINVLYRLMGRDLSRQTGNYLTGHYSDYALVTDGRGKPMPQDPGTSAIASQLISLALGYTEDPRVGNPGELLAFGDVEGAVAAYRYQMDDTQANEGRIPTTAELLGEEWGDYADAIEAAYARALDEEAARDAALEEAAAPAEVAAADAQEQAAQAAPAEAVEGGPIDATTAEVAPAEVAKPLTVARTYDAFRAGNAPKEEMGVGANGEMITGYSGEAYSADYMVPSDETGRGLRWVYVLSDGRRVSQDGVVRILHPEVWDRIKDYSADKRARAGWKALTDEEQISSIAAIDFTPAFERGEQVGDYVKRIGHPVGQYGAGNNVNSALHEIAMVRKYEYQTGQRMIDILDVYQDIYIRQYAALRYGLYSVADFTKRQLFRLSSWAGHQRKDGWKSQYGETIDMVEAELRRNGIEPGNQEQLERYISSHPRERSTEAAAKIARGEEVTLDDAAQVTPERVEAFRSTATTRDELTREIYNAAIAKLRAGGVIRLPSYTRWIEITSPDSMRLTANGYIEHYGSKREGWLRLLDIDPLAAQLNMEGQTDWSIRHPNEGAITTSRIERKYGTGLLGTVQKEVDSLTVYEGQAGNARPGVTPAQMRRAHERMRAVNDARKVKYSDESTLADYIDEYVAQGYTVRVEKNKSYSLVSPDEQHWVTFRKKVEKDYIDTVYNRGEFERNYGFSEDAGTQGGETLFQRRTVTDTPEFREWFGDSKVVDQDGQPLVVYHGTPAGGFDTFSLRHLGDNGFDYGVGFYFSDKREVARGYTGRDGGQVYEVYLAINKPMTTKQKFITRQQVRQIFKRIHELGGDDALANYGDVSYEGLRSVMEGAVKMEYENNETDVDLIASIGNSGTVSYEDLNRIIVEVTGYDGVIADYAGDSRVFVPFTPEQIKSVDNRGTFDPSNPNIYFQRGKADVTQGTFFEAGEDLPLMTGTAMGAEMGTFAPAEGGAEQLSMFGEEEAQPMRPGGGRMVDVTIVGKGVNKRVRVGLDEIEKLRALEAEAQGAAVTYRVVSADGERVYKVGKRLADLLPKAAQGQAALFQTRTDTPEFRRWFGESKVVDEDGKPLVVYHGTRGNFNTFRTRGGEIGYHFGDVTQATHFTYEPFNPDDIPGLSREGANIMPVYLRMENPLRIDFDPTGWSIEDIERIFTQIGETNHAEVLAGWRDRIERSYDRTVRDIWGGRRAGEIDGEAALQADAEASGKKVELQVRATLAYLKSLGYDGIIYLNEHEGATRDISYMVFDPEQVKSVHNRGTFDQADPNILFQRPLVARHNLTEQNLIDADRLGGMPVPSIAITPGDQSYSKYGSITMIGRRPMIDPQRNRYNRVFDADAWTPTARHAKPVYAPVKDKVRLSIRQRLLDMNEGFSVLRHRIDELYEAMGLHPDKEEALEIASKEGGPIRLAFLRENGIDVQPVIHPLRKVNRLGEVAAQSPAFIDWYRENKSRFQNEFDVVDDAQLSSDFAEAIIRSARAYIEENNRPYTAESVLVNHQAVFQDDDGQYRMLPVAVGKYIDIADEILSGKGHYDEYATSDAIQAQFTPELEKAYKDWYTKLLDVYDEPKLQVGRRKLPVTLHNLVEALTAKAIRGSDKGTGPSHLRSLVAREFMSVDEMHLYEDRLVSDPEFQEWKANTEMGQYLDRYTSEAEQKYYTSDFGAFIGAMAALEDVAKSKRITAANLIRTMQKWYGFRQISQEAAEAGITYLKMLRDAPTEYFEAKPQRAVYFDEFAGAVVPEGVDPKVIEILERRGIEYRTYPMRDDAARQAAVESFYDQPDVLFQNRGEGNGAVTVEPVNDPAARHGEMRVVGNVFWTGENGERRLIAYLPERYDTATWRNGPGGRFRLLGLDVTDPSMWVVELEAGGFERLKMEGGEFTAVNAPVGTVDSVDPNPPMAKGEEEFAHETAEPILDALEGRLTEPDAFKGRLPGVRELPEQVRRQMNGWLGTLQGEMSSSKLAAGKIGEGYRDAALLNYSRRTNFDSLLETVYPYQFWYTRSMLNWLGRFADKPSILANYYRLRQMQARHEREGFPTRLKGKVGIPLPFLPDGMGDALYVDPLKQVYPWENFTRPFDRAQDEKNMVMKATLSVLAGWAEEGTYDKQAIQAAIETQQGDLWEQAEAQVKQERDLEFSNPLDVMQQVMSPSLPLKWAYDFTLGDKQDIGQLPFTRMVQALTGLAGVGAPGGVNLEKGTRETLGLPEVDRWQDYRIDRELANMTADGLIDSRAATEAMLTRKGEAYDAAARRIGTQQGVRWLMSSFLADLYPEGERTQRQNADLYYDAIEKWSNGDKEALTKFHEEHPEYEARVMSLKDPEARLHSYLVAEVWDRWNSADRITRKAAQEEFGDLFDTAFLSKETRSYDAISDETLAYWAKMLGADLVEGAPNTPDGTALHVPPPELRAEVDSFYAERDAKFPGIGPWLGVSASMPEGQSLEMPEIDEYYTWRTDWLAEHPDAIPYILGDSNDLSGLPNTVQATVFQYRSLRQNMFPNIFDLQEQYYAIASGDRAGRKAFREAHPELAAYWEFRKAYAAQNPTAAAYILGEDSLADLIAGGGSGANSKAVVEPVDLTTFSPELQGALIRWAYAGEPLGEGAWAELRAEWEAQGQPGGTLAKWMEEGIKAGMGL